jgi:hypothetical protein
MIAARQRTSRIEEPPVLFRLPNLRKRTADEYASPSNFGATPSSEVVFRVDSAENILPRTNDEPVAQAYSPPVMSPLADVAYEPTPSEKSWMERIGSRLILLVTLVVIVSAAWITGRQMPAAKPGGDSTATLTHAESANGDENREASSGLSAIAPNEAVAVTSQPLPNAQSSDFSPTEPQTPSGDLTEMVSTPKPAAQVAALKPEISASTQPSSQTAISEPTDSVFTTVSSPIKPIPTMTASLAPSDHSNVSTVPANANTSIANIPGTAPEQSSVNSVVQSASIHTDTPNELTLDPSILVPWALEQSKASDPVFSATPNPVIDWSRYLPAGSAPANTSVRAVSATEPTGSTQSAQQAAYPTGVTANPYNR